MREGFESLGATPIELTQAPILSHIVRFMKLWACVGGDRYGSGIFFSSVCPAFIAKAKISPKYFSIYKFSFYSAWWSIYVVVKETDGRDAGIDSAGFEKSLRIGG